MKQYHRGFALIETLVIIAVIAVIMALSVRPLRTLISEAPRSVGVCQSMNATMHILSQMKQDIEKSVQIESPGNDTLVLEQTDGTVSYILSNGQITRTPGLADQDAESTWQLPNVVIKSNLWSQNGQGYAVELITYNSQVVLGIEQRRFRQTCVFFKKDTQK